MEYHHTGTSDQAYFNGALYIEVPSVLGTQEFGLKVHTEEAQVTSDLFNIHMENGSASRRCLNIFNEGTGNGIFINQDGNGIALNIDSEATTQPAIAVDIPIADQYYSFQIKHSGNTKFEIGKVDALNQDVYIKLGNSYLWVDSTGDLRIHSAKPSADTSGTVVGTQA